MAEIVLIKEPLLALIIIIAFGMQFLESKKDLGGIFGIFGMLLFYAAVIFLIIFDATLSEISIVFLIGLYININGFCLKNGDNTL